MVLVQHVSIEDVGHRLEAAMRVRRKAGDVVARILRGEFIQHEKRIQPREVRLAEAAAELDAGAVGGGHRLDHLVHGSGGHGPLYVSASSDLFKRAITSRALASAASLLAGLIASPSA